MADRAEFNPPSCFGDHDWELIDDPFSKDYQVLMSCESCGMIQRLYPQNWWANNQLHQQGFNIRPFKPFFDVPESKKGYAG